MRVDLGRRAGARRAPARRSKHDAIRDRRRHDDARRARRRHERGARPALLPRRSAVGAARRPSSWPPGCALRDYLGLTDKNEHVLALVRFDDATPLALGTAPGRRQARRCRRRCRRKPDVEIIGLKPGDAVVGAAPAPDDRRARLRHDRRSAAALRGIRGAPAGRAGGRHGRREPVGDGERRLLRGRAEGDELVAVTISGTEGDCPEPTRDAPRSRGSSEFPAQGPRDRRCARARVPARARTASRSRGSAPRTPRAVGPDGAARHASGGDGQARCLGSAARRGDRLDRRARCV